MTALGFILTLMGFFLAMVFGNSHRTLSYTAEMAGITCFFIGIILSAIGMATWLWKVMP